MRELNREFRGALMLAILALATARFLAAQDTSGQANNPSPSDQNGTTQSDQNGPAPSDQTGGAVPAATGPAEQNVENPPLSGLDAPRAEPAYGGRSYLVPGLQVSESADSNVNGATTGNSHTAEVTRGLGSVDLQKIWKTYQLGLDYIAGGVFYFGPRVTGQTRSYQVHTLAADQRVLWRTGQLTFRDTFDYLPEGTFGFSSYGGTGSFGSALGGISGAGSGLGSGLTGGAPGGLFGGGQYGSVGIQPRIDNLSIVDVVQQLSPRNTVTIGGGYDYLDFLKQSQAPINYINSQQITGQVGFNRLLTAKDQIGFLYAFQEFHFPTLGSGNITAHVWHALYGHRITGRLNFTAGGGPQLVIVHNSPANPFTILTGPTTKTVTANGMVTLHYIFSSRTNGQILYQRYVTPGSGFFAGANTDATRVSLSHLFGRHWNALIDGGYSHNSSLQKNLLTAGINTNSYQYWYAGGSMRRQLGQHFGMFASYQFNRFGSNRCSSSSGSSSICGLTSDQNIGTIGIDWHPRPIRLD